VTGYAALAVVVAVYVAIFFAAGTCFTRSPSAICTLKAPCVGLDCIIPKGRK
jgi:hypothetical protein